MSVKEGGWGAKKELRRVGKERRATFRDTRKVSLRPISRALKGGRGRLCWKNNTQGQGNRKNKCLVCPRL